MSESDKPAEAAAATKARREAIAEPEGRQHFEFHKRVSENTYALRERLKDFTREYSSKLRVKTSERKGSMTTRFTVAIGGDERIRLPYGALEIEVSSDRFRVFDRFPGDVGRYVPKTGSFANVEQVIDSIRDVAAHYIASNGVYPYQHAEWAFAVASGLGGILGLAAWGLCWVLGGGWGLLFGWIAMIAVFKGVRALGPWSLVLPLSAAIGYLAR
jgi:hypothetical protein